MRMRSFLALSAFSACTFLSSVAQAAYFEFPCLANQNFLLGGEVGYARQKEKFLTRFTVPGAIPAVIIDEHEETISDNGTILGLMGGWQFRYFRSMIGVEANVTFADYERPRPFRFATIPDFTDVVYNGTALYKRGTIFGLSTRLGYFVTPGFLVYGRVGAQVSRDEASYQVFTFSGAPTTSDFSSNKKDVYGGVAGLGVEFPTFIGASTFRFEYTFSRTERLNIEDTALPVVGTHHFHYPETNAIKAVWVWNFL